MNPEFRRQLWLGFSATRLVVLPLLLWACFAAAYVTSGSRAATVLAITGAALFAVLVWGMGTFAVGSSVNDEVTDRTWDQQRMSAMQPWAMTWGKLGGASAYAWYGGVLCLAVAVPAGLMGGLGGQVLEIALSAILFGIFLQALLMAVNLQLLKSRSVTARRGGIWLVIAVLFWGAAPLFGESRQLTVTWWGQPFNSVNFGLASMALFAACALVAAWRSMAEVLAVRQWPWGWPALALLITVYVSGFLPSHRTLALGAVGVATCSTLTYLALLTEPQLRPLWQRVVNRLADGEWRAALLQTPRWPFTLLLAVPFALVATVALQQPGAMPWVVTDNNMPFAGISSANYVASFVLLMVRDCALLLFLAFAVNNRRAVTTFLLLMVVLYGLLPWLVNAANSPFLLGLLQPWLAKGSLSLVFAALHAAPWDTPVALQPGFRLQKLHQPLEAAALPAAHYHLIYFDAFAPEKQPELWSEAVFRQRHTPG